MISYVRVFHRQQIRTDRVGEQAVHRSLDSPEPQHTATLTLGVLAKCTKADKMGLAIRPWTDIGLSVCRTSEMLV